MLACDIQNDYLNTVRKKKFYSIAGPEFGRDREGRTVLITRALYGLRSSGARFRDNLASALRKVGFVSCKADPDVWIRPAVKKDGSHYYEYALYYVDGGSGRVRVPRACYGCSEGNLPS